MYHNAKYWREALQAREHAVKLVAMTASLGGLDALSRALGTLPPDFPVPILVVQHMSARYPSHLAEILSQLQHNRRHSADAEPRSSVGHVLAGMRLPVLALPPGAISHG
jgi:chemotaxis response regulator CheB